MPKCKPPPGELVLTPLPPQINAANSPKSQQGMVKTMKYVLVPIMLFGTSFLSAAVNLMGLSFGLATLINTLILNNNAVRRSLGIPLLVREDPRAKPLPATAAAVHQTAAATAASASANSAKLVYEPPRPQQPVSLRDKISRNIGEAKKAAAQKMGDMTGQAGVSAQEKADKRRKEQLRNLEAKRRDQEREHFESKYKGRR